MDREISKGENNARESNACKNDNQPRQKGNKKERSEQSEQSDDGHHRDWWMWLDGTPEKKRNGGGEKRNQLSAQMPPQMGDFLFISRGECNIDLEKVGSAGVENF